MTNSETERRSDAGRGAGLPHGEMKLIEGLVRARGRAKLSQAELAGRMGTTQSAIARLERGGVSPTLSTLRKYAEATGAKLRIVVEIDLEA